MVSQVQNLKKIEIMETQSLFTFHVVYKSIRLIYIYIYIHECLQRQKKIYLSFT